MNENFDINEAKKNLERREQDEKEKREQERLAMFSRATEALKSIPFDPQVEVYLVGSITRPYQFHPHSDVDVVVRNFQGDRFDLWTQLEELIKRNVEIIIFENCHFQDFVLKMGYKVL
jgi:predicted nucleotidyltransferase